MKLYVYIERIYLKKPQSERKKIIYLCLEHMKKEQKDTPWMETLIRVRATTVQP